MQAVPAQATGHYHERPVAPFLRDWFSAVWAHQMPEAEAPPVIVTPDGTIDPHTSLEIPAAVCRSLGLDGVRHWVRFDELNRFTWPGYDVRPRPDGSYQ